MRQICYILKKPTLGGVEVAALANREELERLGVTLRFLVHPSGIPQWKSIFAILKSIRRGDMIVTSLWASHLFVYLASFGRKIDWFVFVHNVRLPTRLATFAHKLALKKAQKAIADSPASREALVQGNLGPIQQISTIRFIPALSLPLIEVKPDRTILFAARNAPQKRIDRLTRIVDALCSQPGWQISIYLAGAPFQRPSSWPEGQVSVYYDCENQAVLSAMEAHKYYLLTSDFEGMSMSTIEAMKCSCIPLVTRVGELNNYISDEENGFFLPDIDGFSPSMIVEFFEQLEKREDLGDIRKKAHQTFLKESYLSDWQAFVESTLPESSQSAGLT